MLIEHRTTIRYLSQSSNSRRRFIETQNNQAYPKSFHNKTVSRPFVSCICVGQDHFDIAITQKRLLALVKLSMESVSRIFAIASLSSI